LPEEIKENKPVISSILNCARAIDITILMALSSIAIKQTKGVARMMEKAKQLLDYLATNPDTTIWYKALDMIMNIYSSVPYLTEANTRSRAWGHFSWGGMLKTATSSCSMAHSLPYVPSSKIPLLKPNLLPFSQL
jgi:hypothetical protein